jgi:hypothetical protein
MRIAAVIAVSLLIAGCSHTGSGGSGQPSGQPQSSTGVSGASPTTPASPSASKPAGVPAAGSPISAVIAWIEAAHPADPARYRAVTRDGVITQLGNDIAFTAAASAVACMTDSKHTGGAPVCLVKLTNPPPQPETAYGDWKGGWVDFDGTILQVGEARGDPGPFVTGNGAELANGDSLSFGDYRCRADQAGAACVNYAHQSAIRLSAAGVDTFGCLKSVPAPDGVGTAFSCSP